MNHELEQIPARILDLATGALAQANMHAVFCDPGSEHWEYISVLNTTHAGALFMTAIIANEHPLLLFKDLFVLDDSHDDLLDIGKIIQRGRTHDFEKLPQVLWVAVGRRMPNMACFERLRRVRNAIQHFCAPEKEDFRSLSLEFIYTIIHPLIADAFGLCAIEYHEDHSIGYDYVVAQVLRNELRFTIPDDFTVSEIDINECIEDTSEEYKGWIRAELSRLSKLHLLGK